MAANDPSSPGSPQMAATSPLASCDSTVVQVLDAKTLKEVARPSTIGVDNGNFISVAWSADGRFLVAGGQWDGGGKNHVRRWAVNAWSQYSDVPVANNTVTDLVALPSGGLLFAAFDPAWGVLNAAGQIQSRQDGAIADLRGPDKLRLSADGRRVRFGYQWPGQDARSFDLVSRSLGADDSALSAARIAAPGLDIKNWRRPHRPHPQWPATEAPAIRDLSQPRHCARF